MHVEVADLEKCRRVLAIHTSIRFTILADIRVVDRPDAAIRFRVVYVRLSLTYARRRRLHVDAMEIPSARHRFRSANWMERERWDLHGVPVSGHDDLRRLLLDYGHLGHPRRKDYPLSGYTEVRYSEATKRVQEAPTERVN